MLNHRLLEVESLVSHVRHECTQMLLTCGTMMTEFLLRLLLSSCFILILNHFVDVT